MDLGKLAALIVVAWLVSRIVEVVVKPLWLRYKLDLFWLAYVAIPLGVLAGLATAVNAFPVFDRWPVVGRGLSVLVVGLGPSFIYDLFDKQPTPPPER